MEQWWAALPAFDRIFWSVAIPATAVLLLHAVLTLIGLGGDLDADVGADVDVDGDGDAEMAGGGLPVFTLRNFEAFFAMFGWGGLVCIDNGLPKVVVVAVATCLGLFSAIGMAFLMRMVYKLQRSGTTNEAEGVGKEAVVYIKIPPKGEGFGKIQLELDGIPRERKAVCEYSESIPAGTAVVVRGYNNNQFLVERR